MNEPYSVAVVVDSNFAERLFEIAAEMPVWIADTPANRAAAERLWAPSAPQPSTQDVTTFAVDPAATPESWLVGILANLDLHHGEYSHDPPYSAIEVYGVSLTPEIRSRCSEYDLLRFVQRTDGFRASKSDAKA